MKKLYLAAQGFNECGVVVFVTMLQIAVVVYGVAHNIIADIIGGSVLFGMCLCHVVEHVIDYVVEHEDEEEV